MTTTLVYFDYSSQHSGDGPAHVLDYILLSVGTKVQLLSLPKWNLRGTPQLPKSTRGARTASNLQHTPSHESSPNEVEGFWPNRPKVYGHQRRRAAMKVIEVHLHAILPASYSQFHCPGGFARRRLAQKNNVS